LRRRTPMSTTVDLGPRSIDRSCEREAGLRPSIVTMRSPLQSPACSAGPPGLIELTQKPMPSATDTPAPTPNDPSPSTPSGPSNPDVRLMIDGGLLDICANHWRVRKAWNVAKICGCEPCYTLRVSSSFPQRQFARIARQTSAQGTGQRRQSRARYIKLDRESVVGTGQGGTGRLGPVRG
jgi:hypothetical protein